MLPSNCATSGHWESLFRLAGMRTGEWATAERVIRMLVE
jgi:hypothetical protein